jgi:transcriptional regulator with XRE-family HTH domain
VVIDGDRQTVASYVTARIKQLARERGLSARDISGQLGRGNSWLSNRYRGAQDYTLRDLGEIAVILEVEIAELVGSVAAGGYVPPSVQQLADDLVAQVLPHYTRVDLTEGEREALVRTVREVLDYYLARGIRYWSEAVATPQQRGPKKGSGRGR